mmetsp:Transcript_20202/g.56845  ORF Transcript_20202/g.56845 Transcript_20202/m.56845 type:complete len:215 (+) Transcript_20202:197-841(+)|eukprot:CAMPEP_0119153340 /NCGR_PEP_ID=MMETSP1310-20130426/49122_1 /TAXON_ID=464262 /ORGANISM="Genus nov. species nov., Strain RCC2339" /LENGTH=214 /DNA_ID=CAMNT_0007145791 /DNA_START=195 /DNA_END=839 /DNA_ORIENTATION=+
MASRLFGGKKQDPVKQAREWKMKIRSEIRVIERHIRDLERAEKETVGYIRDAAKRKDKKSVNILAKELVLARKHKESLYNARSHLIGINTQIQSQIATMRVTGCMQQSAEVMAKMNEVTRVQELNRTMMEMGREMEKAGLIQEMMDEAIEDSFSVDELAVDEAIQQVYDELAIDVDVRTPSVPSGKVEAPEAEGAKEPQLSQQDKDLLSRVEAL